MGPSTGTGQENASTDHVVSVEYMRSRIRDGLHKNITATTDGQITGVRLRDVPDGPTGYLVSFWSVDDGVLLASGNTGELGDDGWRAVTFSAPVTVTKGASYTVVYWASPKDRTPRAARGDSVEVVWAGTKPTPTSTPTPTPTATSTPTSTPTSTATPSKPTSPSPTTSKGTAPAGRPLLPNYPSASNTGVPKGTSLKSSGSLVITKSGTVVDGLDVSGIIQVKASNVTIKNTRVRGAGWWSVDIDDGVTGVVVKDCEINGRGTSGRENSMGIMGPGTFLRNNIYGVENGVTPGSGSLVQDNYIHDLGAPGDPHYDGIQIDGARSNITILHNTVINQFGQTAAVMIDNYFGPIRSVTVENNYLAGGGYTVYSDGQFSGGSITGVRFVRNKVGKGHWGYASVVRNTPEASGNTDADSGKAVRLDRNG
jgi:hypothetical protein